MNFSNYYSIRLIIAAILIFFSQIFAQNPDFSITINVKGGEFDYDLTVGFSPDASDGYDDGIDQYAPPSPPSPSFFTSLIWENDSYFTQIVNGFVNDLEEHIWEIQLQYPEDNLITLHWDNDCLRVLGTFILQDAFGGNLLNVDMTTVDSLVLDNPSLNALKLKVTPKLNSSNISPEEFEFTPNPSAGTFIGTATVNGDNAEECDWIAAFDEDGNCAGSAILIINNNLSWINIPIYGDDNTTPDIDEGMNPGENFILKLWDASTDLILEYSESFDCWSNQNGAPMPGCGGQNEIYDFFFSTYFTVSLQVDPEGSGFVLGSGNYFENDMVTVTANANDGYTFVNWTQNGLELTSETFYIFTITNDRNLVANFEEIVYTGPTADFTYTSNYLIVSFTDVSIAGDGAISTWTWDFGDGDTSGHQNPTHTYTAPGTYSATLIVIDGNSLVATYTAEIVVAAPVGPTADITYTTNYLIASFTDASTAGDGAINTWTWDFGDGSTSAEQSSVHTYAEAGTYTVSLTVTDENNLNDTYTEDNITVEDYTGAGPAASFGYSVNSLEVTFTDISEEGDGAILMWAWDFGDGNSSTDQSPTHTYAGEGTYEVTLTVTDGNELTDSYTASVVVFEPVPPTAGFSFAVNVLAVSFMDESTPGNSDINTWSWDFGDDSTTTEQNPVHIYLKAGNYFVQLVVTDKNGMINERTEFINIATQKLILPVNYPNPFKDNTTIIFLSNSSNVKIDIFNLLGKKVHSLISSYINKEVSLVNWDGKNSRGKLVRAGLYFYHIQTDNKIQTGKMVVIR